VVGFLAQTSLAAGRETPPGIATTGLAMLLVEQNMTLGLEQVATAPLMQIGMLSKARRGG
jgi:hypothetical protein